LIKKRDRDMEDGESERRDKCKRGEKINVE
jgi:hypothetical protein